jgi:hypothetical protein
MTETLAGIGIVATMVGTTFGVAIACDAAWRWARRRLSRGRPYSRGRGSGWGWRQ